MTKPTQSSRPIAIHTPLGEDVLLLQKIHLHDQLSRPFEMVLDLQSENAGIDFNSIVGQSVTVSINLPNYQKRYLNGTVARFVQTNFAGDLANYRATVVPWLWLLTRTSDCRIFQDLNAPDIVKNVVGGHGFNDFRDALTSDYTEREFCVQYNETDFNFVSRLMEEEGIYYYFEHSYDEKAGTGKHTMVLCDSPSAHQPFPGYDSIPYQPEKTVQYGAEHIYAWVLEQEVESGSYGLDDYDYRNPKTDLFVKAQRPQGYAQGEFNQFGYPGKYTTTSEGNTRAGVRIDEAQTPQIVQRGETNALGIAAGYRFALTNFPRQDQNQSYLATGLTLIITTADFSTSGSDQTDYSCVCRFDTLLAARSFRPARVTPKALVPGPQTAKVIGEQGTVETDEYGSVRVQFHWEDRAGSDTQSSSFKIRVSQPWAGNKWGAMFIPHIGNEVVVSFENGDPDRPFVTGRVYNADQKPPLDPSANKDVAIIQDDAGNYIKLDATPGNEKLVLHSPNADTTTTIGGEKGFDHQSKANWEEWIWGVKMTNLFGESWSFVAGAKTDYVVGLSNSIVLGGKVDIYTPLKSQIVLGLEWKYNLGNKTELYTGNIYKLIWGNEYKWESKGKKRLNTDCDELYSKWNIFANTRNAITTSEQKKSAKFEATYGTKKETIGKETIDVATTSTEMVGVKKAIIAGVNLALSTDAGAAIRLTTGIAMTGTNLSMNGAIIKIG